MKQLNKKIISTSILFVILSIWFNFLYVKNESFALTDEDIFKVLKKSLTSEDGLGSYNIKIEDETLKKLAITSG